MLQKTQIKIIFSYRFSLIVTGANIQKKIFRINPNSRIKFEK